MFFVDYPGRDWHFCWSVICQTKLLKSRFSAAMEGRLPVVMITFVGVISIPNILYIVLVDDPVLG